MDSDQFRELQNTISESIEKNVNGKIRNLTEKIDDYIKDDLEHRTEYKKETLEWREKMELKIKPLDNLTGFKNTVTGIVVFLTGLGALTLIILKLLHIGDK